MADAGTMDKTIKVIVQPIVWHDVGFMDHGVARREGKIPAGSTPSMWLVHLDGDYVATIALTESDHVHRRTGEPMRFLSRYSGVHRRVDRREHDDIQTIYGQPGAVELAKMGRAAALAEIAKAMTVVVGILGDREEVDL